MRKTLILSALFLLCPVMIFCQFYMPGMITNKSDIDIYCTAHIKKSVKELLEPVEIMVLEETAFIGLIPFYWNDNFIVNIGIAIFEPEKKIIPHNTYTFNTPYDDYINSKKILDLFTAYRVIKYDPVDPIDPFGDNNTSYHIKTSQYLNYLFSELLLCDENGNTLLTLDDLYEYYEGVNDPEIVTNLWSWSANEYIITITQEMIDSCRKKYEK